MNVQFLLMLFFIQEKKNNLDRLLNIKMNLLSGQIGREIHQTADQVNTGFGVDKCVIYFSLFN